MAKGMIVGLQVRTSIHASGATRGSRAGPTSEGVCPTDEGVCPTTLGTDAGSGSDDYRAGKLGCECR